MKKVPTIVLSVSYKGVKFIDATNKVCVIVQLFIISLYFLQIGIPMRLVLQEQQARERTVALCVFLSFFLFSPKWV